MRVPQLAALAALLALYWIMAVSAASTKSATFDEDVHLTSGYSWWIKNDFRLDSENGSLPGRLGALPLLAMPLRFPSTDDPAWRSQQVSHFSIRFFNQLGNPLNTMLMRARMAMACLGAALGLAVFVISRRLWGTGGGFLSLTLFVFDPNFLAHGPIVAADLAAALFFTIAAWTYWNMLRRITPWTILLAGICAGGLAISKMSSPMFVFMAAAMLIARLLDPSPLVWFGRTAEGRPQRLAILFASSVLCLGVAIAVIWSAYSFRYSMHQPGDPLTLDLDLLLAKSGILSATIRGLRAWHLVPEAWLYGLSSVTLRSATKRACFLVGECGVTGFRMFFPITFLLKTPLSLLFLAGLGAAALWRGPERISRLRWVIPLAVVFVIYWAFAIASPLNIGLRHLLPVYPPLFIVAGGAVGLMRNWRTWPAVVAALLVIWELGASLFIRPHYLAYTNELTGGPSQGYRYMVDSSLDWGQDLPGLRQWLDSHQANEPGRAFVSYFGVADLAHHGIRATSFGPIRPELFPELSAGVYCISATILQTTFSPEFGKWTRGREAVYRQMCRQFGSQSAAELSRKTVPEALRQYADLRFARLFAYLRQRDPDDEIGYSILIYRLTRDDLRAALEGPPVEMVPGAGY